MLSTSDQKVSYWCYHVLSCNGNGQYVVDLVSQNRLKPSTPLTEIAMYPMTVTAYF